MNTSTTDFTVRDLNRHLAKVLGSAYKGKRVGKRKRKVAPA